jgi:hypothetical protein
MGRTIAKAFLWKKTRALTLRNWRIRFSSDKASFLRVNFYRDSRSTPKRLPFWPKSWPKSFKNAAKQEDRDKGLRWAGSSRQPAGGRGNLAIA